MKSSRIVEAFPEVQGQGGSLPAGGGGSAIALPVDGGASGNAFPLRTGTGVDQLPKLPGGGSTSVFHRAEISVIDPTAGEFSELIFVPFPGTLQAVRAIAEITGAEFTGEVDFRFTIDPGFGGTAQTHTSDNNALDWTLSQTGAHPSPGPSDAFTSGTLESYREIICYEARFDADLLVEVAPVNTFIGTLVAEVFFTTEFP